MDPSENITKYELISSFIKEVVAAVISFLLVMLSLYILYTVFSKAGVVEGFDEKAFGRQKDIMLLALGYLGTVTGYYFGRLPSEQQANAARRQAEGANDAAQKARDDKRKVAQIISETIKKVEDNDITGGERATAKSILQDLRNAERQLDLIY